MQKSCRRTGCLIILLLCIVAAAGLWWLMQQSPVKPASKVAPEILTFVDQPDLMVKEIRQDETPYGKVKLLGARLDNGDLVLFDVDESAKVVGFFREDQAGASVTLSLEEARAVALEYAMNHCPDKALLASSAEIAELVDTQANMRYYRFVWIKKDEHSGAYLPQSIHVEINAQTGEVDGYSRLSETVTVDTQPDIERRSAEQTAIKAMEEYLFEPAIAGTRLIVATVPLFEQSGTQALVWQVAVDGIPDESGYVPGVLVFIDANTGKIVHLEPLR